jgi:hypothetical protein
MNKAFILAIGVACVVGFQASAQAPAVRGDATKDLTNCPPSSAGKATSGAASEDAQAIEKSAILPSAGGHENSAAPTVQRNGESVEARIDCPQDADQPKPAAPKG